MPGKKKIKAFKNGRKKYFANTCPKCGVLYEGIGIRFQPMLQKIN